MEFGKVVLLKEKLPSTTLRTALVGVMWRGLQGGSLGVVGWRIIEVYELKVYMGVVWLIFHKKTPLLAIILKYGILIRE